MHKLPAAALALLGFAATAQAHQIWIEQPTGQNAVVRFGEFGENLREASPGLLDKFGKPTGMLLSASGEKRADAAKTAAGFALPFGAAQGDAIVAEDAAYPLYTMKQAGKESRGWYYPAARLATGFAAQPAKLPLDIVPAGQTGALKVFFKGQPLPKAKVNLVTQSGWAKEAHADEQGLVQFDMPWKGSYVAEVSHTDRTAGERGGEKYDTVSYVTTLSYAKADGLAELPAGPAAAPNK